MKLKRTQLRWTCVDVSIIHYCTLLYTIVHCCTLLYTPQELRQADLDRLWNPLLFIDNILSESKEATWLTATVNHKGEAYVMERRRVRGVFMENLELDDFPLDVQVKHRQIYV